VQTYNIEKTEKYAHGVVYIFISVFNLSLFLLFAKLGTENTPFFLLTFLRFLVPLLLLLPFLYYRGLFNKFTLFKDSQHHLSRGFCVLILQYTIFYYLTKGSLLSITALLNLTPIFIALIERSVYKHPIPKSVSISLGVCFIGVLFVLQPDKELFSLFTLVGLLAPICQATSQVLYGITAKREPQEVSIFYLFFIGTLVSFLVFLVASAFVTQTLLSEVKLFLISDWTSFIYLALLSLFTILSQVFRGMAYMHGKPSSFAPFLYFSVFFSALFDWLIFHEPLDALSIIGALLILFGGMTQIYLRNVVHLK
jgi:drug/metabolite transporter (DMT)-like permease